MKTISIIVPCLNEAANLFEFYNEVKKVETILSKKFTFEIIFVDDGSTDNTLAIIKKMKGVKFISFSRNFGKEAAVLAGLKIASGEYIGILDADLQDPPNLIIKMIKYIDQENYDCCIARSINNPHINFFHQKLRTIFYKLITKFSKFSFVEGERDFRLMNRKMVDAIIKTPEYNRYFKGISKYVGFKIKWIEFEIKGRKKDHSKWPKSKLFSYAITAITSFSEKPLIISAVIGFLFFILSFIMIIFVIIRTLLFGDPVSGWPSLVSIILFVSGIQLFCMGIMGLYLSNIYIEVKKRPLYIIKEKN